MPDDTIRIEDPTSTPIEARSSVCTGDPTTGPGEQPRVGRVELGQQQRHRRGPRRDVHALGDAVAPRRAGRDRQPGHRVLVQVAEQTGEEADRERRAQPQAHPGDDRAVVHRRGEVLGDRGTAGSLGMPVTVGRIAAARTVTSLLRADDGCRLPARVAARRIRPVGQSGPMRRLLVGTAVMAACSAGYALAGDLDGHRLRLAAVMVAWWAVAVLTTRWVRARTNQHARPDAANRSGRDGCSLVVFLVALVAQLPGLLSPPRSSSDAYRYVWDGRVQLSGTSPYRYAPLDDRLAALRDPVLFPGLGPQDRSGYLTQPLPTDRAEVLARSANDPPHGDQPPQVPTIYPPVAQAWFTARRLADPVVVGHPRPPGRVSPARRRHRGRAGRPAAPPRPRPLGRPCGGPGAPTVAGRGRQRRPRRRARCRLRRRSPGGAAAATRAGTGAAGAGRSARSGHPRRAS